MIEPIDANELAFFVAIDAIGEARLRRGKIVLDLGNDTMERFIRLASEEKCRATAGEQTDGTAAAIHGLETAVLIDVTDHGYVTIGSLGELKKGQEGAANAHIAVDLNGGIQEGKERVEDDEDGTGIIDGSFKERSVHGKPEGAVVVEDLYAKMEDALEVGTEDGESRHDGVGGAIFGVKDDDVGRLDGRGAIWEGPAGGDACAKVESDKGFAQSRIAIEEAELAARQSARHEPVDGFGDDLAEWLNEAGNGAHEKVPRKVVSEIAGGVNGRERGALSACPTRIKKAASRWGFGENARISRSRWKGADHADQCDKTQTCRSGGHSAT